MQTSSLLIQSVADLEAALDAAADEYGPESVEVQRIGDAVIVMRGFLRDYQNMRASRRSNDADESQ